MTRIAVVEDNADNRLLVRAILEETCEIDEFETGTAALDGMRESPPDIVLLDISLPGMDGTAVLRAMREDERLRHLPVIALTAHAMAGDRERFLGLGFDEYVTKPIIDEAVLVDTVRRLLGRSA